MAEPKKVIVVKNLRGQVLQYLDETGKLWTVKYTGTSGALDDVLPDNIVYFGESAIAPPFIDPSEGGGGGGFTIDMALLKQYITTAYNNGVTETDFGGTIDSPANQYKITATYIAASALISEEVLMSLGDIFDDILAGGGE